MKTFEKHPLNIDFDWNPPSGPYQRISEEQAQSWSDDGFFVLEDAFDAQTISDVLAELDPKEEIVESNLQKVLGGKMFINKAGEDYKFGASAQKKFKDQQKTGKVEISQPDTAGGPSPEYILQNDPKKQFLILQNNKPPKS